MARGGEERKGGEKVDAEGVLKRECVAGCGVGWNVRIYVGSLFSYLVSHESVCEGICKVYEVFEGVHRFSFSFTS